MYSQPEGGVTVVNLVKQHEIRVFEGAWVPVGGREGEQQPVALFHLVSIEVEVLGDQKRHRDRCVCPEQLLDGSVYQCRFAGKAVAVVPVLGQVQGEAPIADHVVSIPDLRRLPDTGTHPEAQRRMIPGSRPAERSGMKSASRVRRCRESADNLGVKRDTT